MMKPIQHNRGRCLLARMKMFFFSSSPLSLCLTMIKYYQADIHVLLLCTSASLFERTSTFFASVQRLSPFQPNKPVRNRFSSFVSLTNNWIGKRHFENCLLKTASGSCRCTWCESLPMFLHARETYRWFDTDDEAKKSLRTDFHVDENERKKKKKKETLTEKTRERVLTNAALKGEEKVSWQ